MFDKIVGAVLKPVLGIVDKLIPDKDLAGKLKHEISTAGLNLATKELEAKSAVLTAELTGESWLQRNWRPIVMLTFTALVVAHWLGFTAPNISDEIVSDLLAIVKVGLGGYVLGRSAEKVAKNWKV